MNRTTVSVNHSLAALIAGILMFAGCCAIPGCSSSVQLTSSWRETGIQIDGQPSDWGSHITPIKNSPVALGTLNDRDFLYLCIVSSDLQFRRQMMGLGLTVWFEPDGGDRIGIHYPTGFRQMGRIPARDSDGSGDRDEGMVNSLAFSDLEILGPEKDDKTVYSPLEIPGVRVKIGQWRGSVVYEIRMPLKKSKSNPIAIDAADGSDVNIEIQGGTVDASMRRFPAEGESGGIEGRGEGMREGRGGGMRGGGRRGGGGQGVQNRPKPIDFEAVIHLAKAGGSQAAG